MDVGVWIITGKYVEYVDVSRLIRVDIKARERSRFLSGGILTPFNLLGLTRTFAFLSAMPMNIR